MIINNYVITNNNKLFYFEQGKGFPIVFLHGYLESNKIWEEFADKLSKNYRVICPDLPGHGLSEQHHKQTVESMADAIYNLLVQLKIQKVFIAGHSMGGYVLLSFAEKFPDVLVGQCLFHSHPFADSEEKINNRKIEIELIKQGKKNAIINNSIPNMYADKYLQKHKNYLNKSLNIALETTEQGMIECINSMMNRKDKTTFLNNTKIKTLWLAGQYDKYFNYKDLNKTDNQKIKKVILSESGHMGMYEESEKSYNVLSDFINSCLKN